MTCPLCDTELSLIGSVGISDVESRWVEDAIRYRCEGNHMVFVTRADSIDEAEDLEEGDRP